jgi:dnd system-associated protein 4
MESKEQRDLAYENKDDYEKLTKDRLSPFYKRDYRDVFLLALAMGVSKNMSRPLKKRIPNIPLRGFTEEEKWFLKSIAISKTGNMEILSDSKEIFKIAEEYANGGIKLLVREVFENISNYDEVLEEELREKVKNK